MLGVALLAPTAQAGAVGTHACTFPLVGTETIDADYTVAATDAADGITISARYSARGEPVLLMPLIGAADFAGTAEVQLKVTRLDGTTQVISTELAIPRTPAPQEPTAPELAFAASGTTPPLEVPAGGFAQVAVTLVMLNLTAYDSGGSPVDGLGSSADSDLSASSFDIPCAAGTAPSAGALMPASSAKSAISTAEYQCTWAALGTQPTTISASLSLPESIAVGDFTPAADYRLSVAMRGGAWAELSKRGVARLKGQATSDQEISWLEQHLTLRAPLAMSPVYLPADAPGDGGFVLAASGTLPRVMLPAADVTTWSEQRLRFNLVATTRTGTVIDGIGTPTDTDKRTDTFDVSCVPDAGTRLLRRYSTAPQSTPSPPTPTPAPQQPSPTPQAAAPTPTPAPAAPLTAREQDAPPAPAPTPTPTPPAEIVVDHRVLRFRGFLIALKYAASCPRRATIVVSARSNGRTLRVRKRVRVRRATRGCTVSTVIRLTPELANQRALTVRITGAGLLTASRRLPLY